MQKKPVITRVVAVAAGAFVLGILGDLPQLVDFALPEAVLEESPAVRRTNRLLPARVVVCFALALALFQDCSYRAVRGKHTTGLGSLARCGRAHSLLWRACHRLGAEPLRLSFESLTGTGPGGLVRRAHGRVDSTSVRLPDPRPVMARFPRRHGLPHEFAYPVLRLRVNSLMLHVC